MRTLILILAGLLIAALAQRLARPSTRTRAAALFTAAWLLTVLWNLATGMSHGYSFAEEAPIQALIFAIPVVFVWWLARRKARAVPPVF